MSTIEKRLHKITPSWLDNLTTPLLTTLITGFVTFLFIGPIMRSAGDYLAAGLSWMYNTLGFIGGGLFGLLYAPITMTGMHHSFIAVETQLIAAKATTGGSFIFPFRIYRWWIIWFIICTYNNDRYAPQFYSSRNSAYSS